MHEFYGDIFINQNLDIEIIYKLFIGVLTCTRGQHKNYSLDVHFE